MQLALSRACVCARARASRKVNLRECEAPTGTGVSQIGLRMRDLNSRVTEEHSRARVLERHQSVDYHRLNYWRQSERWFTTRLEHAQRVLATGLEAESVKNVENKNVATFLFSTFLTDSASRPVANTRWACSSLVVNQRSDWRQ